MQPTKRTGRLLGLLFLLSMILGGTGTAMRGLSGVDTETTGFLVTLAENTVQMRWAIGLDMLGSALGIVIAIFLFPYVKKYSVRLGATYLGIAMINFGVITLSNVIHVTMLSLGEGYASSSFQNEEILVVLAKTLYDSYYWTHFLMLLLYSVGGSALFYILFKTSWVPKWLASWGLLAAMVVFMGGALQMADIRVSFYLFIQNGLFMLVFVLWLLIFGFREQELSNMYPRSLDNCSAH